MKPKRISRPKCYCNAYLRDDGMCPYRCPQDLKGPGRRVQRAAGKRPPHEKWLTYREVNTGAAKALRRSVHHG
jgi:hypothetical protein